MIAKARANLSTERVIMQTETISCVTESGEHFKAEAKGYTAGTDSTFGSTGTFISKQGQVLLAAVLGQHRQKCRGSFGYGPANHHG
jgi:conjugal transfer pilus assembly protein TraB